MTEDGRGGGHKDRTQAGARGSGDRFELTEAGFLQVIRKFYDKNSILRDQADESNQSDLAVDVQSRETQKREHQGARDSQRNGTGQNDKRIAEAFELRREHEIDQNRREQERAQEL